MCRFAAWHGQSVFLKDIITDPCHSLLHQSSHASECKTATNGDGFGVAWYDRLEEPGLYRDTLPAWSDANLKSLCSQISSPLFLAHVRAATHGETSRANCHPFVAGRWSFMHNGQIGDFDRLRRPLEALLDDTHYAMRSGGTDSEVLFLLLLQFGLGNPETALAAMLEAVHRTAEAAGVTPHIRFTSAFSDGETLHGVRYASDERAPSLYVRETETGAVLASEPLNGNGAGWQAVPPATLVTIKGRGTAASLTRLEAAWPKAA